MDSKILKVTITKEHHFDLLRVLFNELDIKFDIYDQPVANTHNENSSLTSTDQCAVDINKFLRKRRLVQKTSLNSKKKNFLFSKKTCHLVILSIREKQKRYLETGKKSDLIPMIYKDIADQVGKDISTVARVAHLEKILLHGEVIFYKDLFKEGTLKTQDGRIVTQYEFFDEILSLIHSENKERPLTDDDLMEELKKKGYMIARRTVAKYRDVFLKIPNSNKRRSI